MNNRLGDFIDKSVSTNAIPNAVVQLNSIGQINADLIPPKTVNYYKSSVDGGRTQLVNYIPATSLVSGDTVVEPTDSFVLITDTVGQYLVLNNSTVYNFLNGDEVVSVTSGGGAIGVVTAPPRIGVGLGTTTLSFPNVGYGTTGLVRGVPLTLNSLVGGSGYNNPGIYTGVRLDTSTGIGTGITATITVGVSGTVTNVAINTGGYKFAVGDVLTLNNPTPIGGRTGGSNFTVNIATVETRLYLALSNGQKFPGSSALSDFVSDRNAVAISTNIGIGYTVTFTPTDISVGGSVDFANDRIVVGSGHSFVDGDPVIYRSGGGTPIGPLLDTTTYYIKTVGLTSVQLLVVAGLLHATSDVPALEVTDELRVVVRTGSGVELLGVRVHALDEACGQFVTTETCLKGTHELLTLVDLCERVRSRDRRRTRSSPSCTSVGVLTHADGGEIASERAERRQSARGRDRDASDLLRREGDLGGGKATNLFIRHGDAAAAVVCDDSSLCRVEGAEHLPRFIDVFAREDVLVGHIGGLELKRRRRDLCSLCGPRSLHLCPLRLDHRTGLLFNLARDGDRFRSRGWRRSGCRCGTPLNLDDHRRRGSRSSGLCSSRRRGLADLLAWCGRLRRSSNRCGSGSDRLGRRCSSNRCGCWRRCRSWRRGRSGRRSLGLHGLKQATTLFGQLLRVRHGSLSTLV